MAKAHQAMGDEVVLCESIDPVSVILNGTSENVKDKYQEIAKSIPTENWIMMDGCEIPLATPPENVHLLRAFSYKQE